MAQEMIKPYGDTLNDGLVQLSFTLPVENSARAIKAAELYVSKLNFENINVVHSKKIGDNFTYFVVFAKAIPDLDYSEVQASEIEIVEMDFHAINERIRKELNRPVCVVGGTIGSDAHTVGIDAIMNMKGYKKDYGLERYPQINAFNLGAQVSCESLVQKALDVDADAILISQTVTKNDNHILNFKELIDLLKEKNIRERFILIAGGPGITNDTALELGYDAGFGPGTLPSQVASFLVEKLVAGHHKLTKGKK